MRNVSILSSDGHAVTPSELWSDYLEKRYHDYLPALRAENELNRRAMFPMNDKQPVPRWICSTPTGAYRREGWRGAWDDDVRPAEMDRRRDGLPRLLSRFRLGFGVMNASYPPEAPREFSMGTSSSPTSSIGEPCGRSCSVVCSTVIPRSS
jgi:hypothetical protein